MHHRRILWSLLATSCLLSASAAEPAPKPQGEVLSREGKVDVALQKKDWEPVNEGQKLAVADRLRTLKLSRAMLQLAELGRVRVNELTTLEVLPPTETTGRTTLDLKGGALYFFSREKPRELLIRTPHAVAASFGTEYLVEITADGRTLFTVFDGEVELSNPQGSIRLLPNEQGSAAPGQAPVKTAVIQAKNLVQWWLYYPGVLDVGELPLTPAERAAIAPSLDAYRSGDLLAALAAYPAGRAPGGDAERAYYANLLLAVGQVDKAQAVLADAAANAPAAEALRQMIATVNLRDFTNAAPPRLAAEWLAQSYYQQSKFDLPGALVSARKAAEVAPESGFAWARVAEMEFSFGRTAATAEALERALKFSPRNAQALALRGFVASAENRIALALKYFNEAIAIDPALGNAWLGRGLCRIRQGDAAGGRTDLQTAAALEPNRSLLRAYLGMAFSNAGGQGEATAQKELALARRLDDSDPTPWLYSALLNRQERRINPAVRDLEESLELNDNRRVYRSRLLLDQDRAVRSSSLAAIYQDAGMNEVSVREAARAVNSDYGNFSAHLFLADSFNALRDPTRFNLRYETAWFNELLLANLLAPVGGGSLSPTVSQSEYSRLFDANRLGFISSTEGRSDKQLRQTVSQFGTVGTTSYSLDLEYQLNRGTRANNDLSRTEWYTTVKQQITPSDTVLFLGKYQDYDSGDNFQYYEPISQSRPNFRFTEYQHPMSTVLGYHHEWGPGVHTLFLGGRIVNDQRFQEIELPGLLLVRAPPPALFQANFDLGYRGQFETYTAELMQIIQREQHTLVFGGRYQSGTFKSSDQMTLAPSFAFAAPFFSNPPALDYVEENFQRISGYGYYTVEALPGLQLTAGLAYDHMEFPLNHRQPPVVQAESSRDQFNPKAAIVWSIQPGLTLRGMYARSLGGVSFDESYRLEPVQLAGFSQAFRTIINESVVGSVSAPKQELSGLALDWKTKTQTYVGLEGQFNQSHVSRGFGIFEAPPAAPPPFPTPSVTANELDYKEWIARLTVNQLLGDYVSAGVHYQLTGSELHNVFPEFPVGTAGADTTRRAWLHEVGGQLLFYHPCGFFARTEARFYTQSNGGYSPSLPGDDVLQWDAFVGWRFPRLHGEISFGVLNLLDQNYRLNPLTPYFEQPRERTYVARLVFRL